MRIDDEIKGSFSDEYHRVLVNLQFTHAHLINKLNKLFGEHGITRQQYNVLRILRGQFPNPAPVSLIKDRMLDKMSDASRIVDRLKRKELVIKKVRTQDRRTADILISDSGMDLLKKLDPSVSNHGNFVNSLSEEEAKQLNELLDKIRG